MRKFAVLAVFVGLLLVLTAIMLAGSLSVIQRLAYVSNASGEVQLRRQQEKAWRPLGSVKQLKTGDAMRTGAKAGVELSWVDGTRAKLGENTELVIRKCTFNANRKVSHSLFRLNLGRIWVRVVQSLKAGSKFEVATPTATAGVRGTVFSVGVDLNGQTEVSVYHGEVAVAAGNSSVSVPAGESVQCGPGQSAQVQKLSPEQQRAWEKNDITRPRLAVTCEPAAGTPGAYDLRVQSEPGATVSVNGKPVTLDERARYSGIVSASREAPQITVIARDARGVEATWEE